MFAQVRLIFCEESTPGCSGGMQCRCSWQVHYPSSCEEAIQTVRGHTRCQCGGPSSSASKTTDFKNIWWSLSSEFQYLISLAEGMQKITLTTTQEHMSGFSEVGDKRKTIWVKAKGKLFYPKQQAVWALRCSIHLLTAALWHHQSHQQKAKEQNGE